MKSGLLIVLFCIPTFQLFSMVDQASATVVSEKGSLITNFQGASSWYSHHFIRMLEELTRELNAEGRVLDVRGIESFVLQQARASVSQPVSVPCQSDGRKVRDIRPCDDDHNY